MRKERAVETDLSNAKVVRYRGTWEMGKLLPRLGVREKRGDVFQGFHYDGTLGLTWEEKDLAAIHDVTVLEEFPTSTLRELVGDAPVFLAKDNHGVMWSFTLYERDSSSTWGDVFIPSRVYPIDWGQGETFHSEIRYYLEEIASVIDMSTVQPLFPRE